VNVDGVDSDIYFLKINLDEIDIEKIHIGCLLVPPSCGSIEM
jgi:hypothetical protein